MGYNAYQGQIVGPFTNGQQLGDLIRDNCKYAQETEPAAKLWHLGIQSEVNSIFKKKKKNIKIGKTGIYEIGNLDIGLYNLSLTPKQNVPASTIIDYVVVPK